MLARSARLSCVALGSRRRALRAKGGERVATMKHLLQLDAKDLNNWADRLPARSELPRIIYRLIYETVEHVNSLSFPFAEGTQLPGWDGRADVLVGNHYVPPGISRWEVKVSRNTTTEANKDYDKRTNSPGDVIPAESTFVFATLRNWTGKDDWCNEKKAEGKWKDVRAYDANDFAAWLNLAPATLTWLSIAVGKQPRGARDLEQEWLNWSEITDPPVSTELVLAGRDESVAAIQAWLSGDSDYLAVRADSHEDAFAIFAACALELPAERREQVLARTVVVYDRDTWDQLVGAQSQLILVSRLRDPGAVAQARRAGHRVFVPLGAADSSTPDALLAGRLSRQKASEALRKTGFDNDRAWRMAGLARRGLKSFQRRLAVNAGYRKPAWAEGEDAIALCPLVLAGAWQADNEDDRTAVGVLADTDYAEAERVLRKWSNDADPPVRFVAGRWVTTSIEDAYSLLAPVMSPGIISAFEEVALDVLGTHERRYELPRGERYLADLRGHGPIYSSTLKNGLATALALAGTRWDDEGGPEGWEYCARRVVGKLLNRANENWLGWASLSGLLPLLAEAAPAEFLGAAESGLDPREKNPTLLRLLEEEEASPLFATSPHTGLLWALETLAWSPQYLSRAVLILGGLARRDPGGRLANRPSASLRGIFLPWHPRTSATLEQRLVALDLLRAREPEVSWRLLVTMLPEDGSIGEINARPTWRDWAAESERTVTRAEYLRAISEVIGRMLADADGVGSRWADLISKIGNLPPDLHDLVLSKLKALSATDVSEDSQAHIWHALRRLVSRHRSYNDAEWALPSERVERLAEVLDQFEPTDVVERYGWLFDHRTDLPEGREEDFQVHAATVEERRRNAVEAILARSGIHGLAEFAERVPQPDFVGAALGQSELLDSAEQEEELLGRYLASENKAHSSLAIQFGWARSRRKGSAWVTSTLGSEAGQTWSSSKRAALLVSLPYERQTFDFVEGLGAQDAAAYWQVASPWRMENSDDLARAVSKLVAARRPGMACRLLSLSSRREGGTEVSPNLVAAALEGLLDGRPDMTPANYDVEELLNNLVDAKDFDRDRVALLEWALLPADGRRSPKALHQKLDKDPSFLALVVSWMCGKKDEETSPPLSEGLSSRAHRLLHSWRTVPGTQPDGSIDGAALKRWVKEARLDLEGRGLLEIGDQMIGQTLSGAPAGRDGAWPHETVRDVIEEVESDDVETGITIGKFNGRGVISRSIEAGGDDERSLAAEYMKYAETVRNGPWPRTAAMLDAIVDEYRTMGRHEDKRSELEGDLD